MESLVSAEVGLIARLEPATECLLLVDVHAVAQLLVDQVDELVVVHSIA